MFRHSLVLALSLALTAPAAHAYCTQPAASPALQADLLRDLNAQRATRGLPKLKLNAALTKAAQKHACDNADRLSISHVSTDGSHLQQRLKRAGYRYSTAGENTGRGFVSGARAVDWWMNSPGHRQNMLRGEIRDIGIGIALSDAPDSRLHWVIDLGATR
ncbi:MAG: CAP domain-containing protein [Paracoccaceae bacterium]